MDLHQQFDTLELGANDFQMRVLDALAEQGPALRHYSTAYQQWRHIRQELSALRGQQAVADKESDYNQFLFDELNDAAFVPDEIEQATADLKLMASAESIKEVLDKIQHALLEAEQPIARQLKIFSSAAQSVSILSSPAAGTVAAPAVRTN